VLKEVENYFQFEINLLIFIFIFFQLLVLSISSVSFAISQRKKLLDLKVVLYIVLKILFLRYTVPFLQFLCSDIVSFFPRKSLRTCIIAASV
jgi:hypothetical protein